MNDINNLTCKFHNPENEAKFLDYDWKTKSRSVRIGLYFIIAFAILNIIPEFFERTSNSNLFGFVSGLIKDTNNVSSKNDLGGAKFIRRRVLASSLDNANFSSGSNPFGTPNANELPKKYILLIEKQLKTENLYSLSVYQFLIYKV